MDIQNHYYGHSAALAHHCGLKKLHHVPGLVQHGWTVVSPVIAQFGDFSDRGPSRRRLVWTSRARGYRLDGAESRFPDGSSQLEPIGSPYLYLRDAVQAADGLPVRGQQTLVLPMHGTALVPVTGDHGKFARKVLQEEGPSMVCLHIDDLQDNELTSAWEDLGHTIVSAGDRRDPRFLGRILWMMYSSRKVVSNRLSTSLLYAGASGAEVSIYGPDFQLGADPAVDPGLKMRSLWPEFYESGADSALLREIAEAELGTADMRTPAALREVLGWNSPSAGPFLDYWLAGPVDKARAVLGLKERPEGAHAQEAGLSPWHWIRHPGKHLPSPLPKLPPLSAVEPIRRVKRNGASA